MIDDPILMQFFVDILTSSSLNASIRARVATTLQACVAMLEAAPSSEPNEADMQNLKRIDKKLYKCRNKEKADLIGLHRARKRDGEKKSDEPDEKAVKKRKLERQKSDLEMDDMFGPSLSVREKATA